MEIQSEVKTSIDSDMDLVLQMLAENQQLLKTNNEMLERQERRAKRDFVFKLVWYAVLLGLPIIMYYFLYNTLMDTLSFGGGEESGISVTTDTLQQLIEAYQVR